MIVDCPRCRARYRVEEEVLAEDPTFKCSRCNHVFLFEWRRDEDMEIVTTDGGPEPEAPHEPPVAGRGVGMSGLERAQAEREAPPPGAVANARRDVREDKSLSFDFGASARRGRDEEDFGFDEDLPHHAPGRHAQGELDDEPRFVRDEDELRREEEGPVAGAGRAYLFFLGVLVMVYAILALDLRNHPARAQSLLGSLPMVGDVLTEDHLLQTRIHLEDLQGAYQSIKDDKLVFILSGRAVNTSDEALKSVQIEGELFDPQGTVLERKSIFCGNAMSLKLVRDLSTSEISLLQRLEPPKRFEIRPGDSAAFSVVFVNPPAGLKEFGARVVGAVSSAG